MQHDNTTAYGPHDNGTSPETQHDNTAAYMQHENTRITKTTKSKGRQRGTRDSGRERFHRTVLNAFYRVMFRETLYTALAPLQEALDTYFEEYGERRGAPGRWCCGKTPPQAFTTRSR